MRDLICPNCSTKFKTNSYQRIYCSDECQYDAQKKRAGHINYCKNISSGTVGTISELRVANDLLTRGYEVYRALSPCCSGDLIATKNDKIFKIEVKTAQYNPSSGYSYYNINIRSKYLALVLIDKIVYKPNFINIREY